MAAFPGVWLSSALLKLEWPCIPPENLTKTQILIQQVWGGQEYAFQTHFSWCQCCWSFDYSLNAEALWYYTGSDGKECASNAGDLGSITGSGRSPGEGNDYPLQGSWLENSTEEPGRLQFMGSQSVGHDWVTNTFTFTYSREVRGNWTDSKLINRFRGASMLP